MKLIRLYQDYQHNNYPLLKALITYFGAENVAWITARDIIENNALNHTVSAFMMPGGADLYYCEQLNGSGNDKIRHYVEQGGTYFGICAGAYYAAREIEWLKGTYDEVSGQRELKFFAGKAIGPIGEYTQKIGERLIDSHIARLTDTDGKTLNAFYWGGPLFVGDGQMQKNILIHARYTDLPGQPAAIIEKEIGRGKVLLASPHLEYSPHDILALGSEIKNTKPHFAQLAKNMGKQDAIRLNLWHKILRRL